jgi:hypothetical protein
MAASTRLTPSQRSMRARLAAHTRWSRTPDRRAATAKQRAAFLDRFERDVDPTGSLSAELRARLAANARSAHFTRMALASVKARAGS